MRASYFSAHSLDMHMMVIHWVSDDDDDCFEADVAL